MNEVGVRCHGPKQTRQRVSTTWPQADRRQIVPTALSRVNARWQQFSVGLIGINRVVTSVVSDEHVPGLTRPRWPVTNGQRVTHASAIRVSTKHSAAENSAYATSVKEKLAERRQLQETCTRRQIGYKRSHLHRVVTFIGIGNPINCSSELWYSLESSLLSKIRFLCFYVIITTKCYRMFRNVTTLILMCTWTHTRTF